MMHIRHAEMGEQLEFSDLKEDESNYFLTALVYYPSGITSKGKPILESSLWVTVIKSLLLRHHCVHTMLTSDVLNRKRPVASRPLGVIVNIVETHYNQFAKHFITHFIWFGTRLSKNVSEWSCRAIIRASMDYGNYIWCNTAGINAWSIKASFLLTGPWFSSIIIHNGL